MMRISWWSKGNICYNYVFCEKLTHRTQGLYESRVLDVIWGIIKCVWSKPQQPKLMIRWHKPITLIATKYDSIGYRLSMLRGMDVFPTLGYYDTRGCGRAMLTHAPQVVVMKMVRFLLWEARSTVQLTLSLLGSYVARLVKLTSNSILVE